ncbi:MAG: rRNA pseudouridine synthase [Erysipelotrichaceae bacterium]|nr:rRNA pseudouridine synthase [Erysipelotrichaceae bacterium]
MRLDKLLSHCGLGTRKEVKDLIKSGQVQVNDKIIKKDGYQVDENNDVIKLNDEMVEYRQYVYIMLNKPAGYISATFDQVHATVVDLIEGYDQFELFPVGRLDIDTEGLLLMTNDGHLAHHILSPKKHVPKVYFAKIDGIVDQSDIEAFKQGIVLSDFICMPANLKILKVENNQSEIEVEIFEGKFHQVKRMFESRLKPVIYLKRIKMKNLVLDPMLKLGQYRELTEEELDELSKL